VFIPLLICFLCPAVVPAMPGGVTPRVPISSILLHPSARSRDKKAFNNHTMLKPPKGRWGGVRAVPGELSVYKMGS